MSKILRKTWISRLDLYLITSDWNELDYPDVWLKYTKIWFMKTSSRVVKYESKVIKSNPVVVDLFSFKLSANKIFIIEINYKWIYGISFWIINLSVMFINVEEKQYWVQCYKYYHRFDLAIWVYNRKAIKHCFCLLWCWQSCCFVTTRRNANLAYALVLKWICAAQIYVGYKNAAI